MNSNSKAPLGRRLTGLAATLYLAGCATAPTGDDGFMQSLEAALDEAATVASLSLNFNDRSTSIQRSLK